LSVPTAAFVHVPQDMIDLLKKEEKYKGFDLRAGTYFATKYLDNAMNFTPALSVQKLENWEMSKIFAFDMLIRNVDRTERKPNLFFHQQRTTLIDHELSLEVQHPFSFYVEKNLYRAIAQGAKGNHLFFNILRQKIKKNEVDFSEFTEYLRTWPNGLLQPYVNQLKKIGYDSSDFDFIKPYLAEVKQKSSDFESILKTLLS
jgi:hypothetical protein